MAIPSFGQARIGRYVKSSPRNPAHFSVRQANPQAMFTTSVEGGGSWWNTEYNTTEDTLFYVTFMASEGAKTEDEQNMSLYLHATARQNTTVTITNPNDLNWSMSFNINASNGRGRGSSGKIPNTQAYLEQQDTIYNRGLIVRSNHPISLYATNYKPAFYDGTNILPYSALYKEYVVQTFMTDQNATEFAIIATENNQQFTLHIKETIINDTLINNYYTYREDSIKYTIKTILLNKGQSYLYRARNATSSLSGSYICSDFPFAMFNGCQGAKVPTNYGVNNHLYSQATSDDQWGKTFIATPTNNQSRDIIRITAAQPNTSVYKDGHFLVMLDSLETYQDTLVSQCYYPTDRHQTAGRFTYEPHSAFYTSSKAIECNIYQTSYAFSTISLETTSLDTDNDTTIYYSSKYGSPVLSPITPQEYGLRTCVFTTFSQANVKEHYVNVVVPTNAVNSMRLNGNSISSESLNNAQFHVVDGNSYYSYAIIRISDGAHILSNSQATFTARVYGLGNVIDNNGIVTNWESYAYNAGSRVMRSADFLIDDQYVKSKTICVNDPAVKFTSIIRYDYDNVRWEFHGSTDSAQYRPAPDGLLGQRTVLTHTIHGDSIINKDWDETGTDTVYMIVQRHTPLCDYPIFDTVKGLIFVRDTFHVQEYKGNLCYGETFTIHTDSGRIVRTLTADTTTIQTIKPYVGQRFKLNTLYGFVDSLKTKEGGCDSIVHQPFIIRPTYEYYVADTICANELPYTYIDNTTKLSKLWPSGPYPKAVDYVDSLHTQYGCDSIIHLHLVIYPYYNKTTPKTICANQDYTWEGRHYVGPDFPNKQPDDILVNIGTKTDSIFLSTQRVHSCDSTLTLSLTVVEQYSVPISRATCQGVPIDIPNFNTGKFPELNFNVVGRQVYVDSLLTADNCDSIVTLTLDVYEQYHIYDTLETCQSSTAFRWENQQLLMEGQHKLHKLVNVSKSGIVKDTIYHTTEHNCDSIYYLYLTVHPRFDTDTARRTICDNESFIWQGRKYAGIHSPDTTGTGGRVFSAGEYVDSVRYESIHGCDSIEWLRLTVNAIKSTYLQTHACTTEEGDSLVFESIRFPLNRVATYDTIKHEQSSVGCDSLVYLHVVVDSSYYFIHYDTICQATPFIWAGHENVSISTASVVNFGTYLDNDTTIFGCDSTHELRLTVLPIFRDSSFRTISEEDTCIWQNVSYGGIKTTLPHDITVTQDTIIYINENTIHHGTYSCDSILILSLRIGKVFRDTIYEYVCQNEPSYQWMRGTELVKTISPVPDIGEHQLYYDNKVTALGFDSLFVLDLVSMPTYSFSDTFHVCQNEDFTWLGHTGNNHNIVSELGISMITFPTDAAGSFIYYDHLTTETYGCDSIWSLNLIVDSIYNFYDTLDVCENASADWQGRVLAGDSSEVLMADSIFTPGVHHLDTTYFTIHGCDSTYHLTLNVHPIYNIVEEQYICDNELPYIWETTDHVGTHLDTISIDRKAKMLNEFEKDTLFQTYTKRLETAHGCDSVVTLCLTVYPTYKFTQDTTVCQNTIDSLWTWIDAKGDTVKVLSIAKAGDYSIGDTTYTEHDCVIFHGIELHVTPIYNFYDTLDVCENASADWQGRVLAGDSSEVLMADSIFTPGVHHLDTTYFTIHGCDSTYHLTLNVHPIYNIVEEQYICDNELPYIWKTHDHNGNHVDSVYITPDRTAKLIDLNSWEKDTLYQTMTKQLESIYGCDSIVTLQLTVHPTYNFTQKDTICQNKEDSLWIWYDKHQQPIDTISIARPCIISRTETHKTDLGCDIYYGLTLVVNPTYSYDSVYNVCQNEAITWQGRTFAGDVCTDSASFKYAPGIYSFDTTYTTIHGCDSSFHLTLNVHPIYDTIDERHICDNELPFVWHRSDHLGSYTDTIFIPDSVIGPVLNETQKDTIFRTLKRRMESVHGCDSIVTLHLTIHPTYFFLTDTTSCANEKVLWRGRYFGSHDTICTDYYTTAEGHCDSIYQLRYHAKPIFWSYQSRELCDNETITHMNNGRDVVWAPGDLIADSIHMQFFTEEGCDSVYCYFLSIHPTYYYEDSLTLCSNDTVLFHEGVYINANIEYPMGEYIQPFDTMFVDSFSTIISGCDSIYTLYAHVLPAYRDIEYDTICANESYTWRSRELANLCAGNHVVYDSLTTRGSECDSIYELRLHVLPAYFYELHETICDEESFFFNGRYLSDTAGVYFFVDSFTTASGCDSVYHLYLTINPSTYVELYDTFCLDEKYYWPSGVLRKEPGVYYDTLTNEYGCNQYTTLYLTRIEPTKIFIQTDSICADDGDVVIHYQYDGITPIAYTVRFDSAAHAQGFEDVIWEPLSKTDSIIYIEVPVGESLPHPDPTYYITRDDKAGFTRGYNYQDMHAYVRPNKYQLTVFLHNGYCPDSTMMDSTQILNVWYPDWIHEQHWNDAIVLYNELYNGGYIWNNYQWYKDGKPLPAQIEEYYYNPQNLDWGHAYNVELTRADDGYTTFTCPIYPDSIIDYLTPKMDYVSVVPTLLFESYPVVNILSTEGGWYALHDVHTGYVNPANLKRFEKNDLNATEVTLVVGDSPVYIMEMRTDSGYIRRQKIIVLKR